MTAIDTHRLVLVAGDAMTTPALGIAPDASVATAWTLMTRHGVRHLLVLDQQHCLGMVDDRTVFALWPLGPARLRRKPVADVMHAAVTCVRTDTELRDVAAAMIRECAGALPVVDDDGRPIGIVTCSDVVAAVALSAGGHDDVRRRS